MPEIQEPKISTKEQIKKQESVVINGMRFVSIKNELYRVYDIPTAFGINKVNINNPVWLFVRQSGAHVVVDASGLTHYIPNTFIHLLWNKRPGTDPAEF